MYLTRLLTTLSFTLRSKHPVEELSFDDLWSALSDDHYNKEVQCVRKAIFMAQRPHQTFSVDTLGR